MPESMHVTFRGEEDVEIEFVDHGYEPDTNYHGIEWWFADPAMKDVEPTAEEDEAIINRIAQRDWPA